MKTKSHRSSDRLILLALLPFLALASLSSALAQTNIWVSSGSDKWEIPADWTLGAPGTNQFCYITNTGSKTVTIDGDTATNFPGTMTISNLVVGSDSTSINTLALLDAGTNTPLHVLGGFSLLGGELLINNSAFQVDGADFGCDTCSFVFDGTTMVNSGVFTATNVGARAALAIGVQQPGTFNVTNSLFNGGTVLVGDQTNGVLNLINSTSTAEVLGIASSPTATGSLLIDGGQYTSPFDIIIGRGGLGSMTVSGAANLQLREIDVGSSSSGTLTVLGGSINPIQLVIGYHAGSTGLLVISNGVISVPNPAAIFAVGYSGNGTLDLEGGSIVAANMPVGYNTGSSGNVIVRGGVLEVTSGFYGGLTLADGGAASTGSVSVASGSLIHTNGAITVGQSGLGTFQVSGGTVQADGFLLGVQPGSQGSLTVSGGSVSSFGSILVGTNGGGVGTVTVLTNGTLSVTNLAGNATINLGPASSLTLDGGLLQLDNLVLTNGGSFTNSGGTLLYTGLFQVESNGTVAVEGGTLLAATNFIVGSASGSVSRVIVSDGGSLTVTNGTIGIGDNGSGTNSGGSGDLTVTNGSVIAKAVVIGGLSGAIHVPANGLITVLSNLVVGLGTNSSGSFDISGGTVIANNVPEVQIGVDGGCGTMTVSSGELQAQAIHAGVNPGSTGKLILSGGVISIHNHSFAKGLSSNSCGATGEVQVISGTLMAPSNTMSLGTVNVAKMTMSGGTVELGALIAGGGAGSIGTIALSGGDIKVNGNITLAPSNATTTATATISGGTVTATNGIVSVGSMGTGVMTISSGGKVTAQQLKLGGSTPGAVGQLVLHSGGIMKILGGGCAACGFSSNDGEQDGGDLDASQTSLVIGEDHNALYHISGGTAIASLMFVGYTPGFTGTFTQDGGTVTITTNLIVGDCAGGALGVPTLNGGTLYVTNAAHTAVLDVRNGTFTLNAGATLVVDTLIVTNTCGHFVKHGGALVAGGIVLDPNQSAVGDGIPNGWKQQYGLDPFDPTVANADPDHDGQSNLNEYLAGTNPTNAASVFKMLGAALTNQNVRVDWSTVGGHSYVVQTDGNLGAGGFNDLSPAIPVAGTNESTTNYIHTGAGTNNSGFYRIRLGP